MRVWRRTSDGKLVNVMVNSNSMDSEIFGSIFEKVLEELPQIDESALQVLRESMKTHRAESE